MHHFAKTDSGQTKGKRSEDPGAGGLAAGGQAPGGSGRPASLGRGGRGGAQATKTTRF